MTSKFNQNLITFSFLSLILIATPALAFGKEIGVDPVPTTIIGTVAPKPATTPASDPIPAPPANDISSTISSALNSIVGLLYEQIPKPVAVQPDAAATSVSTTPAAKAEPVPTVTTTVTREPILSATPNAKQKSQINYETILKPTVKAKPPVVGQAAIVPPLAKPVKIITSAKFELPAALSQFAQSFSYPAKPLTQQQSNRLYLLAGILALAGSVIALIPNSKRRYRTVENSNLNNILGNIQV